MYIVYVNIEIYTLLYVNTCIVDIQGVFKKAYCDFIEINKKLEVFIDFIYLFFYLSRVLFSKLLLFFYLYGLTVEFSFFRAILYL